MAWEWVSPVSTAVAGVAGVYFTYRAGKQGRDHAEAVAINQTANARLLAIDARQQQRIENAYLEALNEAERVGHWAQLVYPFVDTNPPQQPPVLPSLEDQAKTAAVIHAFGSREVQQLLEDWRKVVVKMTTQASLIGMQEAGISIKARMTLEELRPNERGARLALGEQMSKELKANYGLVPIADRRSFPWRTMQDD